MAGVTYNPETGIVTLEDGYQMSFADWLIQDRPRTGPQPNTEHDRLKEFFFGAPKSEPQTDLLKQWKLEGRCPVCGELGRIHLSTFICSRHGVY